MPAAIAVWSVGVLVIGFAVPETDAREKDLSFVSDFDRTEQRYVVLLPEGVQDPHGHDVLVLLHGHGSDRWQFIRDARDECRASRDVAREKGLIVVAPDYRATTSWMGPAAEADVVQILRTLKTEYAPPRIFLCGGSMGAASALTFAVLHPDLIDGVAAMNGVANHVEYENFQDAISASFGGNKHDRPAEYKKRSAEFSPERLTMPVGLTVGGKDTSTPPGSVLRLAKALKSLGRCVLLIERPDGEHATNYDDARAILEYVVEKAGKTPEPGK